jgi:hypothetical protein
MTNRGSTTIATALVIRAQGQTVPTRIYDGRKSKKGKGTYTSRLPGRHRAGDPSQMHLLVRVGLRVSS